MSKDTKINDLLENNKFEPFTLLHDILINWWVILLGAIAAALIAYVGVGFTYSPDYTTSATFAVSSRLDSGSYSILSSAIQMSGTFQ